MRPVDGGAALPAEGGPALPAEGGPARPAEGDAAGWRPAALADAAGSARSEADLVTSGVTVRLSYLSQVSASLGLPNPVADYYEPMAGRWHDLHDESVRWRRAARSVEEIADGVTAPLRRLDAAWHGPMSESFSEHIREVGRAGASTVDAMAALADVLDRTAEAMGRLVNDTAELLAAGADRVSLALLLPVDGEARAARHIAELRRHGRRMLDEAHELLDAFARVCQRLADQQPFAGLGGPAAARAAGASFAPGLAAALPGEAAALGGDAAALGDGAAVPAGHPDGAATVGSGPPAAGSMPAALSASSAGPPEPAMRTFAVELGAAGPGDAVTAAGAAPSGAVEGPAAGGGRAAAAGMAAPFLPMAAGMAGQGDDRERGSKPGVRADPVEIFGKPSRTPPPVIGAD